MPYLDISFMGSNIKTSDIITEKTVSIFPIVNAISYQSNDMQTNDSPLSLANRFLLVLHNLYTLRSSHVCINQCIHYTNRIY